MRKEIYKANTRGQGKLPWLTSFHTFSFAGYFNKERMNFGSLRVFNDDFIAAGGGFDTHPHNNMEIVSIPLSGAIEHKDTMGNKLVINSNEIQVMSAGSGIQHSEFNASKTQEAHMLQIWVYPKIKDIKPSYQQKNFTGLEREQLIVSPDGQGGSLKINQDAYFYRLNLSKDEEYHYKLNLLDNGVFIFVIEGEVNIDNDKLTKSDGIGISLSQSVYIKSSLDSKILIIEVPMNRK